MTIFCRFVLLTLTFFCLATPVLALESALDPAARISELETQNKKLHHQLRLARRQLAETRNVAQEPGWQQVFGGVGVIFGLCGIGMMISARKQQKNSSSKD